MFSDFTIRLFVVFIIAMQLISGLGTIKIIAMLQRLEDDLGDWEDES